MKVIFIFDSAFTDRDFSRLEIAKFLVQRVDVRVFELNFEEESKFKRKFFEGHTLIENYDEFEKKLCELDENDYIISFLNSGIKTWRKWRLLSLSRANFVKINLACLPNVNNDSNIIKKAWTKFLLYIQKPHYFLDMIYGKIPNKILGIRDYDLYLVAGKRAIPADVSARKILKCNCYDYKYFLENPAIGLSNHIVFLDEFEPFHPDFKKYNLKTISPTPYYEELNIFFDFLEKKYSIPVVIAAHPSVSDLEKYQLFFPHKKIIQNKTFELIRDAKYVVGHTSTSLQLAMLYGKPITLLTTDEMNKTYKKKYFSIFEEEYFFDVFNISNVDNFNFFNFKVNLEGFRLYLEYFSLSQPLENKTAWDIFINFIKSKTV